MSNNYPTVSIIIPAYNAEETIEKCLKSLTELYYPGEYQVILVNNRSTDSTVNLARKYNVKIIDACSLQSSYYARNVGIAHSNAQIVAFTDSDCIADKNWIHYLAKTMMQDPQIGGIGGRILYMMNNKLESIFAKFGIGTHHFENPLPYLITANAAYRMDVLKEIGLFDETFFSGGDVDLSWRIVKKGYKLHYEPRAIIYHFTRKNVYLFFRQHYIYGMGQARLCFKHKIDQGLCKRDISQLLSLFRVVLILLSLGFPYRVMRSLVNKEAKNAKYIMIPVFNAIMLFASTVGFIRGTKMLRLKSNPQPRLFISSS